MKDSEADARRWLSQAGNDLEFGRLAVREEFFAQVCFVSHQVVGKSFKALAYYRGDRIVVGHSLIALVTRLESTYSKVSSLIGITRTIEQYDVPTRYANALAGSAPFEVFGQKPVQRSGGRRRGGSPAGQRPYRVRPVPVLDAALLVLL